MTLLRKSLSEDFVDRYNHTWFFWSLLVLSVVTWLLPLSPTLHPAPTSRLQPGYSARCWCPSEFTDSHRTYTDTICSTAFNHVVRGEPRGPDVQLLKDPETDFEISRPVNETDYAPGDESEGGLEFFLFVKTPLMLFLLALCLKLPHYTWRQFTPFYGGDLSVVLEATVQRTAGQDPESRRLVLQGILGAFVKSNPKNSAVLWYIKQKAFTCVTAVGGLLTTTFYLFPELAELEEQRSVVTAEHTEDFSTLILFCGFSMRSFGKLLRYSVQCSFERSAPGSAPAATSDTPLELYKALYSALMVAFCALAVVNILSLVTCLVKLYRHRTARGKHLSLDGHLLVNLAQDNFGPHAGQELVEILGSLDTKVEDNQVV